MAAQMSMRRMPDPAAWLRRIAMSLPGTTETRSWGHPNFRASGRTYAAFEIYKRRPCIAVSARPDEQDFLVRHFGFFRTPYVGHRGWVSVWVDEPSPIRLISDLVKGAHRRLTAPDGRAGPVRGAKRGAASARAARVPRAVRPRRAKRGRAI